MRIYEDDDIITEFNKEYSPRYIIKCKEHPNTGYVLSDNRKRQKYNLVFKNDEPLYYALEIVGQGNDSFIMYRKGSTSYCFRNQYNGEDYMITNKSVCKNVTDLLNEYDRKTKGIRED